MKKPLFNIMLTAVAVLALAGSTAYANQHKKIALSKKPKNQVEMMYFQHARQARVSVSETHKNCYTLTLFEISPNVIYFSNTPSHVSGRMNLDKYNTTWQHAENVDGIKPNAVLHAYKTKNYSETSSPTNMTVVLSQLKYNQKDKTISYTACPLNQGEQFALASESVPVSLYEVDLFIDPIRPWPP